MPVKLTSDLQAVKVLKEKDSESLYGAVRHIKNRVIGSKQRKQEYIDNGILPSLIEVLKLQLCPVSIEAAYICNSIAHGGREHVLELTKSGVVEPLIEGLFNEDMKFVEACLLTLRTIFQYPEVELGNLWEREDYIPRLIHLMSTSDTAGQSTAMLIGSICKTKEHQTILSTTTILDNLAHLLSTTHTHSLLAALFCLSEFTYDNTLITGELKTNQTRLVSRLFELMKRDQYILVQYNAAKCLTNIYKLGVLEDDSEKTLILDTIVYLCLYDDMAIKHIGANLLHDLIEQNSELQLMASYSQHLMKGLYKYFSISKDPVFSPLLRTAAFKAFASLGESQEEIRETIIESENIVSQLKFGLQDSNLQVQIGALSCLHSLSRSVKQLRTSLLDAEVWQPLLRLIKTDDVSLVRTSSRTLCNLLLDFSPSKDMLLEQGDMIHLLSNLIAHPDEEVRLNAVWAIMNMSYKATTSVRAQITSHFNIPMILDTIDDQESPRIRIKALGLLRNLLCESEEADCVMTTHGSDLLGTLLPLLKNGSEEEQEQVMCVFINIASGIIAKDLLMARDDWLSALLDFLKHNSIQLQIAATTCITHIVKSDDRGCMERQCKLKLMGHFKQLQSMLSYRPEVSDRVKIALQYFN